MATAPLTTQVATYAGLTPSFTAAAGAGAGNGFTFANDNDTYVRLKNTSGSPVVATIKAVGSVGGVPIADQTVTIPATTGDVTIKCDPTAFGGTTTIEVASATNVSAAAFK